MLRFICHVFGILMLVLFFAALPVFSKNRNLQKNQVFLDSAITIIDKPVKINVFPAVNKTTGIARIFIKATRIGNQSITLPMLFDTGSAGVTINAIRVFPSSIVDTTGFKFKNGQDTIQYAGIVITRLNVQKSYGDPGKILSRMTGNIGYTDLTVGDRAGTVKMKRIPILFFYKRWSYSEKIDINKQPSIFGVNPAYENISETTNPAAKHQMISPFKYLPYSNGVIAGFKLDKITLTGCNINAPGDCTPQKLTIGVTAEDEATFSLNSLDKQRPQLTDLPQHDEMGSSYTAFYSAIADCLIKPGTANSKTRVLLDTGNPGVVIGGLKDTLNNTTPARIELTTPSHTTYFYDPNKVNFKTRWEAAARYSVFGVYFFTSFDFLEDYQNGKIGLK